MTILILNKIMIWVIIKMTKDQAFLSLLFAHPNASLLISLNIAEYLILIQVWIEVGAALVEVTTIKESRIMWCRGQTVDNLPTVISRQSSFVATSFTKVNKAGSNLYSS